MMMTMTRLVKVSLTCHKITMTMVTMEGLFSYLGSFMALSWFSYYFS